MKINIPLNENFLLGLNSVHKTQKSTIEALCNVPVDNLVLHLRGIKIWVWEKVNIII